MQTFGVAVYKRVLSARYRARMVLIETGRFEKLSACHRTASALINTIIGALSNSDDALVDRDDYDQNLFTRATNAASLAVLGSLLDGDSRSRGDTLALATISEALMQAHSRLCFGYEAEMMERVITVLETLEKLVCL